MNSTVLSDTVFCLTKMLTNDIENDHQSNNQNLDVSNVNRYLLNPTSNCNIDTCIVQTIHITSKAVQVIKEIENYKLGILGISECRWNGSGIICTKSETGDSYTIIYSGQQNTHYRGITLIMNKQSVSTLMEWEPINERLIKYCKLTIIQCYAPTNDSEDEVKEDLYEQLQADVAKVPQHDMLLVMGDMNGKIGSDNTDRERAIGSQGCGTINNNGERLVNLCLNNNCVIGGTIFHHKYIHKLTWKSPDGKTVNQIDHVVINNKWRCWK